MFSNFDEIVVFWIEIFFLPCSPVEISVLSKFDQIFEFWVEIFVSPSSPVEMFVPR